MGGVLPEVVADDKELERAVCDGYLEQRARRVLAGGVGVVEEGGDGDVDGVCARVDDADDVLAAGLFLLDEGLLVYVEVERRLLWHEVPRDQWLGLLGLQLQRAGFGEVWWEALDVLHAAVQRVLAGADFGDLACRAFGCTVGVSAGDLDLAHCERFDAIDAVDSAFEAVVFQALLIEPEVERVARRDFKREVVASGSLLHVV